MGKELALARLRVSPSTALVLAACGALSGLLLSTGRPDHPDLHIALDTGISLLSGILALLFWDMGVRIRGQLPRLLAIGFGVTCLLESVHALVGVEWSGALAIINQAEALIRPATWPPPSYVLPLAITGSISLVSRNRVRPATFTFVLLLLGFAFLAIFPSLPRYVDPGWLGITRPTLVFVPILWVVVGSMLWRLRTIERIVRALLPMAAVLVIAHIFMLYSRAPHDPPAMVAHLGKVCAYLVLLLALMQMAAEDMRERIGAERKLVSFTADLEQRVRDRTAQLELSNETLAREIAVRREAEIAVRKGRDLLQAVADHATAIIWVKDLDGRYLLIQGNYEILFNLPREDIVGKTDYQLFDPAQADTFRAADRQALAAGKAVQTEEPAFYGERPVTLLSVKCPLVGENGEPYALCGISTDITERKQAEHDLVEERSLLRTLIDGIPDPVFTKDTSGRFTMCNAAELINVGLQSQAQLIGKTVFDLYPAELANRYHADDLAALSGIPVINREEPSLDVRGNRRWYLTVKLPLYDHAGKVMGLVGTSRDITELKRAEENRHRAQKHEALGTLAGGVAHDFNNILLAISGNTRLAIEDLPIDHPTQESLLEINQACVRAIDLVKQILSFTRAHEPKVTAMALSPVAEEVCKLLRSSLPANIRLDLISSSPLPLIVADASQIHQVLMNLTMNAAHAIGVRGGLIEIRLSPIQVSQEMRAMLSDLRPGPYVRVSLSDNGCGMDKETLERMFDPFFTTKPVGEGTGLGLSVVHGVMKQHEGAISVYSVIGKGTTFNLYFPAFEGEIAANEAIQVVPPRAAGERILYVDDEEALVSLASRLLRRLGYQVFAYTNPQEALEKYRSCPLDFDVVVTDLSMPGFSGFDLAQSILHIRPGMPIVMTSGYLRPEDQRAAAQMGLLALIPKPNTIDELADVLNQLFSDNRGPKDINSSPNLSKDD